MVAIIGLGLAGAAIQAVGWWIVLTTLQGARRRGYGFGFSLWTVGVLIFASGFWNVISNENLWEKLR